ncbi:MAG: hypothetical protein Q7S27_03585 [Nanoarchaeota archaeon]|nr:hypothetical protein [Nanoarchaeota archaeon]
MIDPIKSLERYKRIMDSQGSEESDLLGVLEQALHHNFPNTYHLGLRVGLMTGDESMIFNSVTDRVALVNRHVRDAQSALRKIYDVAKEKGYKEITDIFERTYHIGHSSDNSED